MIKEKVFPDLFQKKLGGEQMKCNLCDRESEFGVIAHGRFFCTRCRRLISLPDLSEFNEK